MSKPVTSFTSVVLVYPQGIPTPEEQLAQWQRKITDPLVQIVTGEKSIKIAQIRDLQARLATTHSGDRSQLVVITPANRLTAAAQQSLLKTIEEPPTNTQIILTVTTPQQLLPTIQSRCQIKVIFNESSSIKQESLWQQGQNLSLQDKVTLTQKLPSDRQEALALLEQELLLLRSTAPTEALVAWQYRVLETINGLRHNVNVGLSWEYLLVNKK